MSILDIILLICFIPAIVNGVTKGFIGQIVQLAAIIIGAWVAYNFSSLICKWVLNYISMDGTLLKVIVFILVIVLVTMILNIVGNILTRMLKAISLGWLNLVMGVLFSMLKTALILGVLIMIFEALNSSLGLIDRSSLDNSKVYLALHDMTAKVFPFLKGLIVK